MREKPKKNEKYTSQSGDSEFNLGARFISIISGTSTFFVIWLFIILATTVYQFGKTFVTEAKEVISSEETAIAVEDGIDSAKDEFDFFISDLIDSISDYL